MPDSFELYCLEGALQSKRFPLSKKCLIGRNEGNDIVLPDKKCSGRHLELMQQSAETWLLKDLKSSNGTRMNGQLVQEHLLKVGEQFEIGATCFRVVPVGLSEEEVRSFSLTPAPILREVSKNEEDLQTRPFLPWQAIVLGVAFLLLVVFIGLFSGSSTPQDNTDSSTEITDPSDSQNQKTTRVETESQRYEREFAKIVALEKLLRYNEAVELTESLSEQVTLLERKNSLKTRLEENRQIAFLLNTFFHAINEPGPKVFYPKGGKAWVGLATAEHFSTASEAQMFFQTWIYPWEKTALADVFDLIERFQILKQDPENLSYAASLLAMRAQEKTWALRFLAHYLTQRPDQREQVNQWYFLAIGTRIEDYVLFHGELIPLQEKEQILAREKTQLEQEQRRLKEELLQKRQQELKQLEEQLERETFDEKMSRIESLVKVYQYQQAGAEFQLFKKHLKLPELRQKVEQRYQEIQPMANLFARMLQQLNEGQLSQSKMKFGTSTGTLKSGGETRFEVEFEDGGKASLEWRQLYPQQLYRFFLRMKLSTEDRLLVSVFCYENGLEEEANKNFIQVLETQIPEYKTRIDQYLAQKLEIPIPEGGFTPYKGVLVTPEEKEKRSQGFVRYDGKWVTPADREKYLQGLVPHQGKWVSQEDKSLLEKGFSQFEGKWYSREEIQKIRSVWENAWTLKTEHYEIRANISEEFIQELGAFMEASYQEYVKFFGKDIQTTSTLYAFRTFEDYRNYCIQTKNEDHLKAEGFAVSSTNIGCGWMSSKRPQDLLWTMVHEGAHLYYFKAFPRSRAPSWYAEAVATQFEGYQWSFTDKSIKFSFLSKRLTGLKVYIGRKRTFPLLEFFKNDAGVLINQTSDVEAASIFYAQAWGLYYFLSHTENTDYQQKWAEFQKEMHKSGGGSDLFLKYFGNDLQRLEQDFESFILNLYF